MNAALIVMHVLGAAVWTGGHIVLAVGFLPAALRERDPQIITGFESRFERIGIPALVIQVITGVLLAWPLLSNPDEPIGAHVAGSLGVKLVLLLVTLALAAHARLRLIPRLRPDNLGTLAIHIVAVTVVAILFVVVGVAIRLAP
jgi:putative copper export protein